MIAPMKTLRFRFITIAVKEQFFAVVRRGIADAAAAMGVEAELVGTPGVAAEEVIALTRQAIADRVDGIALNIDEPNTFAQVIAEARSRSIPVVAFNIDAGKGASGNLSSIMQDFHSAGQALGRRASRSIGEGATAIVTVHDEGVGALEERLAGVQAGLGRPDSQWIRLCTGQDPERGAELLCDALAGCPAEAILATGQADTEAAGLAAKRFATRRIYVAGFDLSPVIVDLIADGFVDCVIDQQPYAQGFYPVVQLALYLSYGLIPSSLDAGSAIIDRSNIESLRRLSRQSIR
jgi:simple sugar transport system substrate-binding protein